MDGMDRKSGAQTEARTDVQYYICVQRGGHLLHQVTVSLHQNPSLLKSLPITNL